MNFCTLTEKTERPKMQINMRETGKKCGENMQFITTKRSILTQYFRYLLIVDVTSA